MELFLIFLALFIGMIDKRNEANSSQWMKKVTSKNDSFTRVHEDPILMIKQGEKKVIGIISTCNIHPFIIPFNFKAMESVINNPLKMDKIKQRISLELQEKDGEKKLQKQERKKLKKAKKEEKKQKRRLDSENLDKQTKAKVSRSRSSSASSSSNRYVKFYCFNVNSC